MKQEISDYSLCIENIQKKRKELEMVKQVIVKKNSLYRILEKTLVRFKKQNVSPERIIKIEIELLKVAKEIKYLQEKKTKFDYDIEDLLYDHQEYGKWLEEMDTETMLPT